MRSRSSKPSFFGMHRWPLFAGLAVLSLWWVQAPVLAEGPDPPAPIPPSIQGSAGDTSEPAADTPSHSPSRDGSDSSTQFVQQPAQLPETKVPAVPIPPTEVPATEPEPTLGAPGGPFSTAVTGPFMPGVQGTRIYAGKKTFVSDLNAVPQIANSNYDQALLRIPGILLAKETIPRLSMARRGLGEPHRSQHIQILKDGFPLPADLYGYPESYYSPPLEAVDHIDFIFGGAALMYGPQVGGAVNFITHMPADVPFRLISQHIFGSHSFYSTYDAVTGTAGDVGYYLYGHYRDTDGFRISNSDVEVRYGGGKFLVPLSEDSRLIVMFDFYSDEHGEPGGITLANLQAGNIGLVTRPNDRFELDRNFGYLTHQVRLSEETLIENRLWAGYYRRDSRRQTGGGFGTLATGGTNNIELQAFRTFGLESRARHDWYWRGEEQPNTLAAGYTYYLNPSDRSNRRGTTPTATDGLIDQDFDRLSTSLSLFLENRFRFGRLSVTPGVRLENIWQNVEENLRRNAAGVLLAPRPTRVDYDFVALFGIGTAFEVAQASEVYFNYSQSYRPIVFTELLSTGATQSAQDIEPGFGEEFDLGIRGAPASWLYWDTSIFYIEFDNQIATLAGQRLPDGTIGTLITNGGTSVHRGWDASIGLGLVDLWDQQTGSDWASRLGSVEVFVNTSILHAQFIEGANAGLTVRQAPHHLTRAGLQYTLRSAEEMAGGGYGNGGYGARSGGSGSTTAYSAPLLRILFAGTYVSDMPGDDSTTAATRGLRRIPSFSFWDLTLESRVWRENVFVQAGINNIFNETYASDVRGGGFNPADGRNYYGGFRIVW